MVDPWNGREAKMAEILVCPNPEDNMIAMVCVPGPDPGMINDMVQEELACPDGSSFLFHG